MKKIFILFSLVFITGISIAQKIVPCVTDELYNEALKNHPNLKLEEDFANNLAAQIQPLRKAGTIRYIPVVFHVIHKYGFENISQTQINDAIRVLNEDFRKKAGTNGGSSTDPLAIDMEYEFRLAQFDPNGQPTTGVNRIYNLGTDNARDAQKSLSVWDARKYFNVWVVNSIQNTTGDAGTILGYAQFPFQINSAAGTDGVMMMYNQVGAIEVADLSQMGRTFTHETGHWVGLYHPFQGGCVGGTTSNCAQQGDQVCDTPPVAAANYGCPTNKNSCSNDVPNLPDLVKDYMDYADGTCMNLFTPGQKVRVDPIVANYRANIFTTSNLSAAGINADGTYKTLTPATLKAPYQFGFNVSSLAGTGWTLENYMSPGDSGWQVNNTIGAVGSGCIASMNVKNWRTNLRNAFVSPSFDLTPLSAPKLSFYIAYAKRTTASGDKVRVYISNSFGRSEILAKTILASEMETGSISTSGFFPTSTEWKKISIDLAPYKSYTNCRIRFELQSLRGNNIFIDEFTISEPTGLLKNLAPDINFQLFPNPSKENSTVSFDLPNRNLLIVTILDLQGKVVKELANRLFEAGKNTIEFDVRGLNSGLYIIQVNTESGIYNKKLLVE